MPGFMDFLGPPGAFRFLVLSDSEASWPGAGVEFPSETASFICVGLSRLGSSTASMGESESDSDLVSVFGRN